MKRLTAILLVLALAIGMAAITTAATAESVSYSEFKIGCILDNTTAEARIRGRDKMQELADMYGFEFIFQDSAMDETKQMQQVENMIALNVDALIIMPVNYESIEPAIRECNAEGIPVIVYGRMIYNCDIAAFVGADTSLVGTMQVNYLLDNFPVTEHQNWIVLAGPFTDPSCPIWYDQWMDALQPYIDNGLVTIVGDAQIEAADTEISMKTTENFLTAVNDDVQVVLAVSDSVATGAAQALAARSLTDVKITGLDAETIVLKRIAEGTQTMTIALDDNAFAEAAIEATLAILTGAGIDTEDYKNNNNSDVPCLYVTPLIVDANNLAEIVAMGYGTVDEVYADIPVEQWPEQFQN